MLKGCLSRQEDGLHFRKGWIQRKKNCRGNMGEFGKPCIRAQMRWQLAAPCHTSGSSVWSISGVKCFYSTVEYQLSSAQLALNLNQVVIGKSRAEWFQASHTICLKWGLVSDWSGAADCWFDFLKQPERLVHRHTAGSNNAIIIERHSHRVLAGLHPF